MNNYEQSIFCDKNVDLLDTFISTPIDISIPNIVIDNSNNLIQYSNTRYIDRFAYYKNDTIIGHSIKHYGEYTELEIELLKNFINKEFIVYDVGANIGYHTLAFSKLAKYVYAFEPNTKHYKLLESNTKTLDNVKLYKNIVSDNTGSKHVQDFDINVPGNYGELYVDKSGELVDCIKIDDLDDIYGPDLLKIDVEGHELQVLRGAIDTIKEFNPIIFYEAHGTELSDIYDLLTSLEYTLYWYPCPNYNPRNYKNNSINLFGHGGVVNILAMPKNKPKISNLVQVIDNTDTIQQAFQRAMDMNK